MHEYSLHAQVSVVRGRQVLNILAGVTASPPVPVCEENIVLAERKPAEQPALKKVPKWPHYVRYKADLPPQLKQQQQQQPKNQSYCRLIRDVATQHDGALGYGPWQLRAELTPDPGVPNFTSRRVDQDEDVLNPAGFEGFHKRYELKRAYTLIGYRFVYGNVIVRIVRFHIPESDTIQIESLTPPTDLKLLDPSGNWLVEAVTRVEDLASTDLTDKAKRELLSFHSLMEGAVDFYVPDRFALDTRIRNV